MWKKINKYVGLLNLSLGLGLLIFTLHNHKNADIKLILISLYVVHINLVWGVRLLFDKE